MATDNGIMFLLISFLLKWLTCLLTALSAFGFAQGGKGKSCKLSKLTAGAVCAWQFVAGKSCKLAYCGCCVRLALLRCCQASRPDTSGSAPAGMLQNSLVILSPLNRLRELVACYLANLQQFPREMTIQ